MSKSTERKERLMPNGIPRHIRCYDNGGKTADRYTIVFSGNFSGRNGQCHYLGCCDNPYHPQGIGMHGSSNEIIDYPTYSHLGKKVKFETLPEMVKKIIINDYSYFWDLR